MRSFQNRDRRQLGRGRLRRNSVIWLLSALLGIGLAIFGIDRLNAAVRPTAESLAKVKIENRITKIVADAVSHTLERENISYSDIVSLQRDDSGKISALTTNPALLNTIRVSVLKDVLWQVEKLDKFDLGIPLGNLTGIVWALDWGPILPVRVLSAAAVDCTLCNDFTSAGINQTLHRIMLSLTVDVRLLIPGGCTETTVETNATLAETVIVGDVPHALLHSDEASPQIALTN